MTLDLDELERLGREAMPGPWQREGADVAWCVAALNHWQEMIDELRRLRAMLVEVSIAESAFWKVMAAGDDANMKAASDRRDAAMVAIHKAGEALSQMPSREDIAKATRPAMTEEELEAMRKADKRYLDDY